ncbi:aminoacetone oxidase family FAD-binding enzyme [Maritimibacter sp. 55A14]|uniref:NAD(P)/FAD-dependent oxidoreductase n=1 Tax=Maritimibacter sp. 55A14 TaxID=2174844 RepID=UPI000D604291|nr:NAD(P)/FAD-dependent oxidoreductase [Maritimibacter sp. 55A14]PWE34061.1 aminoacetone oxidase family FAD-binding enzyme [Maritimibacter sp. 55A14]
MAARQATRYDTVILGAGAAGMFCAAHAGATGGRVLVIDHARAPGEKIRISGGGRCNFTNLHCGPENFLSANPHFARSALARYTQWDFIELVERHAIGWHEKTLGQLFCDRSARDIIAMLLDEQARAGAELSLGTTLERVEPGGAGFALHLAGARTDRVECRNLVIACGGKSIPKMGATGHGYSIARQFGHAVTETRPALVPLTFSADTLERCRALAGTAAPARVTAGGTGFEEALLFTHRGLSGPAVLQASSYWREGAEIEISLCPGRDALDWLRAERAQSGRRAPATVLAELLPRRLAAEIAQETGLEGNLADQSDAALAKLAARLERWTLTPTGTEGYRTAEITLGGVDTAALEARSLASRHVPGLYFIGEVVDVTGWLGGYNFQWAWSSGWAAGTAIAAG